MLSGPADDASLPTSRSAGLAITLAVVIGLLIGFVPSVFVAYSRYV